MTIPYFIDSVIIGVSGGVRTTETKFSPENIQDNLWECREVQMQVVYKKTGRINPLWTSQYIPDFSKVLQDEDNVLKFEIPPFAQLDDQVLGIMYAGSKDCLNSYRVFRSRAEYASARKHRVQKESTVPVIIYSDSIVEVHNTKLSKIDLRLDSVFYNPTKLPTFNSELSDIPLDGDNLSIVRQMVIQTLLGAEAKTPADFKQNNKDISAV